MNTIFKKEEGTKRNVFIILLKNTFENGDCFSCKNGGCSSMGYFSDKYPGRGSMYLKTTGSAPFCGYNYLIEIKISSKSKKTNGDLIFTLNDKNGRQEDEWYLFNGQLSDMNPGQFVKKTVVSDLDIIKINPFKISFKKKPKPFLFSDKNAPTVMIDSITITNKDINEPLYYCGDSIELQDAVTTSLTFKKQC
jgi:hypothetical protein